MSTAFTLYCAPGAASFVTHVAMKHLDLPHTLSLVALADGQQRSPEYLALNPKGRVPALTGGTLPTGEVLTEAPAICRYLCAQKPDAGLWPTHPLAEARLMEWLNYLSGHFHAFAWALFARPARFSTDESHYEALGKQARVHIEEVVALIEDRLGDGRAFAVPAVGPDAPSQLTPADFYLLIIYRWIFVRLAWPLRDKAPLWTALVDRLLALPAVQATLAAEKLEYWPKAA